MKIKITRANGDVIEAEGTAEECKALLADAPTFVPYYVPSVWSPWWVMSPTYVAPSWTGSTTSTLMVGPDYIPNGIADGSVSFTLGVPS